MTVLAIDTATEILGIALRTRDGSFFERTSIAGLQHVQRLMPGIDQLFSDVGIAIGDVDLLVCAKGPGSFTGLRIGMATAKGLRTAIGCPMVSVPTLDALAYPFSGVGLPVLPAIDARKNRIYCAVYVRGERTTEYLDIPVEIAAEHLTSEHKACMVTGVSQSSVERIAESIPNSVVDPCSERGRGSAYISLGTALYAQGVIEEDDSGPLYLRRSDAEEKREEKNGTVAK